MAGETLAGTFNFVVTLNKSAGSGSDKGPNKSPSPLAKGGFQECSGLDIEMDVQELMEGGRNDGLVRLIGRGRYSNIVLKRGMLYPAGGSVNGELWGWLQDVLSGVRPVPRYDGIIQVLSAEARLAEAKRTVATWYFDRALPAKIAGPQLNARTGEIAVEELTLAHEGLRLRI